MEETFKEVHRITKEGRFFVLNTSPIIIPRTGRKYSSIRYPIPYDINEFANQVRGDLFHQYLYQKVITQEYKNKFMIFYTCNLGNLDMFVDELAYINNQVRIFNPLNLKHLKPSTDSLFKNSLKSIIFFGDYILGKLIKNYKVVIVNIKMPHISLLKTSNPKFILLLIPGLKIYEGNVYWNPDI